MIFFKKPSLTSIFGNNWLKLQMLGGLKKKMQCRMKDLAQYHK